MEKRLTKALLLCFALAALLAILTIGAAAETDNGYCGADGDNLSWTLDTNGTLTISGAGEMENFQYAQTPWHSFRSQISRVILNENITSIGTWAFFDCGALISVDMPESLITIGDYAFDNCSALSEIAIPDGVTSIGKQAFYFCENLTGFFIPSNISFIDEQAWTYCQNLEEITVDPDNSLFYSIDGALIRKDSENNTIEFFRYPPAKPGTEYIMPDGVTTIKQAAFEGCYQLESVILPDSVTRIDADAFYTCGLKSVEISKYITDIGENAFSQCDNLAELVVDTENHNYCAQDSVLFNKDCTVLICYPNGKTPWGTENAAYSVPNTVTRIGKDAFSLSRLSKITIPESVIAINERAFWSCSNLSEITLPDGLSSIGAQAFYFCAKLKSVVIPESVQIIDRYAFWQCNNLTDVYYGGSETQWNAIENIAESYLIADTITIHYGKTDSDALIPGSTRMIPATGNYTASLDYSGENLKTGIAYQIAYAIYDANGQILDFYTKNITFDDTFRASLAIRNTQADTQCRIFLLDDIYAPMSAAAQLNFM